MPASLSPLPPAPAGQPFTRESLFDGSVMAALKACAPPDVRLRTQEELDACLDATLASHDPADDLYLFGYGSLMWNPAIHHIDAAPALVRGWGRRFCLWLYMARGSVEHPGLMLALDRGGACRGIALRIAAEQVRSELQLVWRREMLSGAYAARWVMAECQGERRRMLTFVANRKHPRYAGRMEPGEVARYIASGRGTLGTCRDYFQRTIYALKSLEVDDPEMRRLVQALDSEPRSIT
ncbi:gamma-glutamylcyclotransferase [Pseudacidovorax sp. RU35E]|uniref:gamma-glutamylcyclotransferase n=1 Tax=Pseudacidovorax sp. RU35E TaxID=1907403 RepID=UPI000955F9B3|nr:gamma-glutamylcyclotransferase [Pseudacidovorax sp. RU35E]SIR38862.1 cation transport protein ChaC [Pseudacidovorax sp. RU35E]